MASKAAGKRIGTKKKATSKKAEGPFFQPFAQLGKKASKKGPKNVADTKTETKTQTPQKPAPSHPTPPPQPTAAPEPEGPSEAETFAMFMAGVRPLNAKAASRLPKTDQEPPKPKPAGKPEKDPDADARAALHSLVSEGYRFEVSDDGAHIEGRRMDVDPRELRRLRRGAYTIDGRLDLHGMNAADARRSVETFIRKKRTDGERVVALIVGRGNHSPRGIGVLRGEIAAWLSQGASARHVAAFASAPEEEGGAGVVLALLAR